jgi:hypothetical protein
MRRGTALALSGWVGEDPKACRVESRALPCSRHAGSPCQRPFRRRRPAAGVESGAATTIRRPGLGGGVGVCCGTTCTASIVNPRLMVPQGFVADPNNCGGCGRVCPAGSACDQSFTCTLRCPTAPCPAGSTCVGGNQPVCMPTSCASQPDGVRCAGAEIWGICCEGVCVNPTTDNRNCGGCGMPCCGGTQCSSADGVSVAGVCLKPGL